MRKIIITLVALLTLTGSTIYASDIKEGSVIVSLPSDYNRDQLSVTHSLISDMLKGKSAVEMNIKSDNFSVSDGKSVIRLDTVGAARYSIDLSPEMHVDFYAAPTEFLTVDIKSLSPLSYTVKGTPLMEGMTELSNMTAPIEEEFAALSTRGNVTPEEAQTVYDRYDQVVKDFLADNPDSPAAAFAMLNLGGQEFLNAYNSLGETARQSIMMPFVESQLPRVQKQAEQEHFQKSLEAGAIEAPDFTLPDLEGKPVSLSDFKGKWVVLDFWGSWCGWCIKGFPKLKETYARYNGKFEVIGIDCRDPEASWRAAVVKYDLPWINLYNAQSEGGVTEAYHVTGFPTKAIVNPEGKLVDLTVGEDPSFYEKLVRFIGE